MLDNWMVTFKEEIAKQSDGSTGSTAKFKVDCKKFKKLR